MTDATEEIKKSISEAVYFGECLEHRAEIRNYSDEEMRGHESDFIKSMTRCLVFKLGLDEEATDD